MIEGDEPGETMSDAIRVIQLSDTHFREDDAEPEGNHSYDVDLAFEAVLGHLGDHGDHDMVVVTGDVADHGRSGQYQKAATAFSQFTIPVNVTPGNHDQAAAFVAGMGRPGVGTSRVVEAGPWAFLFVDSNAGNMVEHPSGRLVDHEDYDNRLHREGSLGEREATWVHDMCTATAAEHVFVWVHHPPANPVPLMKATDYTAEWSSLLSALPQIRGLGTGHTHIPASYEFEGRGIHVAPSFKNSFDLENETWLPPGYRTYRFETDGSVSSELHLVDHERWPRRPLGRALKSLFMGEITFEQLEAIAARRAASTD
ncbi:MAG: hypothetical protein GY745_21835 [Actinomycetia bacterium]|nr:hypothetical protein [Actinomycetes bacterium]